jgi:hypothetical protein
MTASTANQVLGYGSLITTTGTLIGQCRLRQRLGAYVTSFSACRPFPQPTAITGKDDNLQKPQLSASSGTLSSQYRAPYFLSFFLRVN